MGQIVGGRLRERFRVDSRSCRNGSGSVHGAAERMSARLQVPADGFSTVSRSDPEQHRAWDGMNKRSFFFYISILGQSQRNRRKKFAYFFRKPPNWADFSKTSENISLILSVNAVLAKIEANFSLISAARRLCADTRRTAAPHLYAFAAKNSRSAPSSGCSDLKSAYSSTCENPARIRAPRIHSGS